MNVALITGITGQDGSYLAELLLEKGYEVHGVRRRSSSFNTGRIDSLIHDPYEKKTKLHLHYGDLTDSLSLLNIMQRVKPTEIYNLGAQSHVAVSFETPEYTANSDALGTLRLLETVRALKLTEKIRFYQASTSELFGAAEQIPQDENTPFNPQSPYAAAKLYSYWITKIYRESYGLYAVNGVLFNHESPRRGETFVTRKITRALARMYFGLQTKLVLGNLNALRDWGHAKEYVNAMWMMLQQKKPQDLVISTGEQMSIKQFCELCLVSFGVEIEWLMNARGEVGIIKHLQRPFGTKSVGDVLIETDDGYTRPSEVPNLIGNPALALKEMGWSAKISIKELASEMIKHDIMLAKAEAKLIEL